MSRFRIIPLDPAFKTAEVLAPDRATALHIIAQAGCPAARVERDGQHVFDAKLDENGVWSIIPAPATESEIPVRTA